MQRVFIALILMLLLPSIQLYAQQGETVRKEHSLDLQVVYEKTFDEQIVDVIFDTATVSKEEAIKMGWKEIASVNRKNGDVSVSLPAVTIVSNGRFGRFYVSETKRSCVEIKEIKFYDKDGRTRNVLKIGESGEEKVFVSSHNRCVLVNRRPTEYKYQYSGGTVYALNGEKIWEIEKDGPSPIAISDEGYAVAAYYPGASPIPGGDFYVYNPNGQLINTVKNPDTNEVAPIFAEYADDDAYAVMSFQVATDAPPTIFVFTTGEGRILWDRRFPDYRFSGYEEEIEVAPIGVIGILDFPTTVFYVDQKGVLRWTLPLEARGAMIVKIAEDSKKAFVVSSKGYVWCISTDAGKILWKHREPWSPEPTNKISPPDVPHFSELRVNENILFIIGKKGIPWHSTTLFVFDSETGNLLKRIEYPQEKITFAQIDKDVALVNITDRQVSILKQGVSK